MNSNIDDFEDNIAFGGENQCLIFCIKNLIFGVQIDNVIEIVGSSGLTKVPLSKSSILGVINLRGEVVGIIDILRILQNEQTTLNEKSSFVVLDKTYNEKKQVVAFLVSEVYEVVNIPEEEQKQPPSFGTKIPSQYIKFIAPYNDELIEILDMEALLSLEVII